MNKKKTPNLSLGVLVRLVEIENLYSNFLTKKSNLICNMM